MKLKHLSSAFVLCIALLQGNSPLLLAAETIPPKERMVVVISIDGLPAWMWEESRFPTPTLRRLAREGAVARLKVSNPTVTWPNHTTLITGVNASRHGVLYNGLLTRNEKKPPTVEPWKDKKVLIRVPTVYDLAYQAGLTTAHVDWIPTTNSGTFTWEFPEIPNPRGLIEQEMVKKGWVTAEELSTFRTGNPAWRDLIWTRAAVHLIEEHRPNLLLYHLLNTDSSNHRYGPASMASYSAFAYADKCVEDVLNALKRAGQDGKATVLVVTDHGFKTAKRIIRPNRVLRDAGLLQATGTKVESCEVYAMTQGGIANLYVTHSERRGELLPRLSELFAKVEGVERVIGPEQYAQLGLPTPEQNPQAPDLILVPKQDYAFHGSPAEGEHVTDVQPDTYPGHHGYLNSDPELDGVLIAWGWGIRKGISLDRVSNLDVAPTLAKLLEVKLNDVEGKPLERMLESSK